MHIGLVIPSVNVVIERDLWRFSPPDVAAHVTRIPLTATSAAALRLALAAAPDAAQLLADADVSAIALACTGASMMAGHGEPSAAQRLTERTGLPAIDTMGALFLAFDALAARRIVLVSPFGDEFNAAEADALRAGGLKVVAMKGFGITDPARCPAIEPGAIVTEAAAADVSEADAVFLSCANLRGFEAIAPLEQRIGKPVVASNQAVLWALLQLCGANRPVQGGGILFDVKPELN